MAEVLSGRDPASPNRLTPLARQPRAYPAVQGASGLLATTRSERLSKIQVGSGLPYPTHPSLLTKISSQPLNDCRQQLIQDRG